MSADTCIGWGRAGLAALLAGYALLVVGGTGCGADEDRALIPTYVGTAGVASEDDEVNALLNLKRSTVLKLSIDEPPGGPLTIVVPIEGSNYTVDLAPHSVRSESYEVKAQLPDGSYISVEPGPVRTLRGTVRGIDGSAVAASLLDDGLRARIILPGDVTYWIEPLPSPGYSSKPASTSARVKTGGSVSSIVYRSDDVIPSGGTCIALDSPLAGDATHGETTGGERGGVATGGFFITELAIDADFEYFQDFRLYPDPLAETEGRINDIINSMNAQYERDVGIRHVISTIIVRTAEPDPYSSTDPVALLYQFKNHWQAQQTSVRRDVAQLFTGKNIDDNVIGIAFLNSVCSTYLGYSVVESNCSGCVSMQCKTDLSAHELGHNWGAYHCGYEGPDDPEPCLPSCPGWTMNCFLTCANRFHQSYTIPDIIVHRDSRTCLCKEQLRRIILSADTHTVIEGDTLQFTATADIRCAELDVTSEASWSVDRPEVGAIDSNGLFTAADVEGDACVTISASYTFDDVTRTNDETIMVLDKDAPLAVVDGVPPDGAIDARQLTEPDGTNPDGWKSLEVTFNGEACLMSAADFAVEHEHEGGVKPGLPIVDLEHVGARTVRLLLSEVIEPGAWTTATHIDSGAGIQVGFLPGDVDADGTASALDILALIGAVDGVGDPRPIWSIDTDRSGQTTPADILRLIDLLTGADVYESWIGRRLPP